MSYAFLDDVYNTQIKSNLDNDYNEIVQNILGIKSTSIKPTENKYNLTNKIEPKIFTNEIPQEKEEEIKEKNKVKKIENFNNEPTMKECEDFIRHLEKCKRCRMMLIKKFNLDKKPEDYRREEYLDIVIYGLTGIFLLFLIDIVLNFGKKLGQK